MNNHYNTSRNLDSISDSISKIDKAEVGKLSDQVKDHKDIIIIGNGGSNAMASHMAIDYTKFLCKRCTSFDEGPRLTCYFNDYGVEEAYRRYLNEFISDNNYLVILISSSGESKNIINCAEYCCRNGINFVILTGMREDNKLRMLYGGQASADIWVDSDKYSVIECTHEVCLHSLVGS